MSFRHLPKCLVGDTSPQPKPGAPRHHQLGYTGVTFISGLLQLCFSLGSTALMETSAIRLSLRDVGVFGRKGFCLGLVFCLDVLSDRLHV